MSTADLFTAIAEKQSARTFELFEQEMFSRIAEQFNKRRPQLAESIFQNISEAYVQNNSNRTAGYNAGDRDPAEDNVIAQMRKAQDLGKPAMVKFRTGVSQISPEDIQTVLQYHQNIAKPGDKLRYQNAITASPEHFKRVVSTLKGLKEALDEELDQLDEISKNLAINVQDQARSKLRNLDKKYNPSNKIVPDDVEMSPADKIAQNRHKEAIGRSSTVMKKTSPWNNMKAKTQKTDDERIQQDYHSGTQNRYTGV